VSDELRDFCERSAISIECIDVGENRVRRRARSARLLLLLLLLLVTFDHPRSHTSK
jgi:hypothetical protein